MTIQDTLRGKSYTFETKPGLFSKDKVDDGSRLLIEIIDIKPTDVVVDLGCGYGAIGLVAASLANKGKVYMVDTDIRAVKHSQTNAKLNEIDNVDIRVSDGFEAIVDTPFEIDVVVSNPPTHLPKETLLEFIDGAKTYLKKGGGVYFVTEKRIKPLLEREFEKTFGNFEEVASGKQHVVLLARKS